MNTPEMYPLVDNPKYHETFETFGELKEHCEATFGGLNFPLSWFIFDEQSEDWGKPWSEGDAREFAILNFMPRKGAAAQWSTHNFDSAEVREWLNTFVKAKVMEWYGWAE